MFFRSIIFSYEGQRLSFNDENRRYLKLYFNMVDGVKQ